MCQPCLCACHPHWGCVLIGRFEGTAAPYFIWLHWHVDLPSRVAFQSWDWQGAFLVGNHLGRWVASLHTQFNLFGLYLALSGFNGIQFAVKFGTSSTFWSLKINFFLGFIWNNPKCGMVCCIPCFIWMFCVIFDHNINPEWASKCGHFWRKTWADGRLFFCKCCMNWLLLLIQFLIHLFPFIFCCLYFPLSTHAWPSPFWVGMPVSLHAAQFWLHEIGSNAAWVLLKNT